MKSGANEGDYRVTARQLRRIDPALERQFQAEFDREGLGLRSELWLLILLGVGFVLLFLRYLLKTPPELLPWTPLLLVGVGIPALLRWLSGSGSPLRRWSQGLFVVATYLDVICMMAIHVVSERHGMDILPIVVPISVLMSLVVVQLRFALLVPTILLGLVGVAVADLTLTTPNSNALFQLVASSAIVCVSLTSAYELQNSSRAAWLRQRELIELTRIDSLTGLPNRRYFDETLRDAVAGGEPIVLAIFDLDAFKAFNDRYGHPAGDACLQAVGAHLRDQTDPQREFVARHAGEEFVMMCRGVDPDEARARVEQIRHSIGEMHVGPRGRVTASAGSADLRVRPGLSADEQAGLIRALIERADKALYRAKESGRDRTEHDPTPVLTADPVPAVSVAADYGGPHLHASATTLRFVDAENESAFVEMFDVQGRRARRFIMIGLLLVCAVIFTFQEPLLKIPPAASTFGRLTLALGIAPAAVVALVGSTWTRLWRWSAPIYVGAVAVVLAAQMFERVIQTPKGFDVVPFLMPVSVLLSMTVVRIVYRLLMPSMVVLLTGLICCELATMRVDGNEVLTVLTTLLMAYVAVRFAYALERNYRLDWSRSKFLEALSETDPLTQLPNRRAFTAKLHDELSARRSIVLVLLDVDYFKSYNDQLGHTAGDQCLRSVGTQLWRAAEVHGGTAARLGGEEFAVILPNSDDPGPVAEELRAAASMEDVGGLPITVSAGLAEWPLGEPVDDLDAVVSELMSRADAALYEAKRLGRNRLVVDRSEV